MNNGKDKLCGVDDKGESDQFAVMTSSCCSGDIYFIEYILYCNVHEQGCTLQCGSAIVKFHKKGSYSATQLQYLQYTVEYTSVVISAHSGPITKMAQLSQACMCCTSFHFLNHKDLNFCLAQTFLLLQSTLAKKKKHFFKPHGFMNQTQVIFLISR